MGKVLPGCNGSGARIRLRAPSDRRQHQAFLAGLGALPGPSSVASGGDLPSFALADLTSVMAHSPPEGRQAVPWSDEATSWPETWAVKDRQISSFLTKGWPTGVKKPFSAVSGLSQDTWAPEP